MQRLEPELARERLESLRHWRHDERRGAITREFAFADFAHSATSTWRATPTRRSSDFRHPSNRGN